MVFIRCTCLVPQYYRRLLVLYAYEFQDRYGQYSARRVIGRIHGAIVAATVASCIHYRRPVGATIAPTVAATIAPCIRPIRNNLCTCRIHESFLNRDVSMFHCCIEKMNLILKVKVVMLNE